jgi:hypothetical protein
MSEDCKTLLIVFHTITGGTEQMARAAARGAAIEPAVRVRLLHAAEAKPTDVLAANGYIFATPETLGAVSGLMKQTPAEILAPKNIAPQVLEPCTELGATLVAGLALGAY